MTRGGRLSKASLLFIADMRLHSFLEVKNTQRWSFLQSGIFPAASTKAIHSTLWHQPFDFEDDQVVDLLFGEHGLLKVRTFPTDMSSDMRLIRSNFHNVLDEGYLPVNELLTVYSEHYRFTLPRETSLFWRDLQLIQTLGMPHRVRLICWLT